MPIPDFTASGNLPPGVHRAALAEVVEKFGGPTPPRQVIARRLRRIHELATRTGHLARFVVFGSFVTDKPDPNDVDVFLLMEDSFDVDALTGEASLIFRHAAAQAYAGGSVFWLRRLAALGGEDAAIEHWQVTRDGTQRGIVEIIPESP